MAERTSVSKITLALLAAIALACPGAWGLTIPDPSSVAYYTLVALAGDEIEVGSDSQVTGNLHGNQEVTVDSGAVVDGDVSGGEVENEGTVLGTLTENAPPRTLPTLWTEAEARAIADTIYEEDIELIDFTVTGVIFVAGTARLLGTIDGTGTIIATEAIEVGEVEEGEGDSLLGDGAQIALVAFGEVKLLEHRWFRGVLLAGEEVVLDESVTFEGVAIAGGEVEIKEHAVVTFLTPDDTPPSLFDQAPADGSILASSPAIAAMFVDDLSDVAPTTFSLTVDAVDHTAEAAVTAGGFSLGPIPDLADGTHTITVGLADYAGNVGQTIWAFTLDTIPPTLAITAPGSLVLGDSTPAIGLAYGDSGSGIDPASLSVSVDGVDITSACSTTGSPATCEPPELVEGTHTVVASVSDLVENLSSDASIFELVLDLEPPTIAITAPTDGSAVSSPQIEVSGTVSDDGTVAGVSVNGTTATFADGAFAALVVVEEGFNAILAVATDATGKQGFASSIVILDTEPPSITIDRPADGALSNGGTVRIAGRVADNQTVDSVTIAGVPAVLDFGAFEETVPLAEGDNTVTIAATDEAGNSSTTSLTVIYFTLPEIEITTPADFVTITDVTAAVSGTVSDSSATVTVNGVSAVLDGSTFTATGVPLIEGGNTLTAVTTDSNGHVSTDSVTVVRDLEPPRGTIYSPLDGQTLFTSTVTVRGLVNDIVQGTVNATEATVTVNGFAADVANRSFVVRDVPLVLGENLIEVSVVDEGGNEGYAALTVYREAPNGKRVEIVSGDDQAGAIGQVLPSPFVVRVLDEAGDPVAGVPVLFKVVGNDGSLDGGQRQIAVTSDGAGLAQATFMLGNRSGVANQLVEVLAVGYGFPVTFASSAVPGSPALIVVDSGNQQVATAGRPLPRPLVAATVDAGSNRLGNVSVTFRVVKGMGTFDNGLPEVTAVTDSDGRAIVPFTLDPEEGISNNVVEATVVGLDGSFAAFYASSKTAGDPAATSVSGVVLDNTGIPIAGVTARIVGTPLETTTDDQGQFRLGGAPVGHVELIIDGATANRPGTWPTLQFELTTVPGRDNDAGMPIHLLPIDVAGGLFVSELDGGVLTLADFPGFSLEIKPGSVTFPDGSRSGIVSATIVHSDKVPMVPNFGQQPRFILTIQPAGAVFDPPARVAFPNVEGYAPGHVTELYSFDHDLGIFVSIGPGTVADDGVVVRSNDGVGIVKAGWTCGGDPVRSGTPYLCPTCQECDGIACQARDDLTCTEGDLGDPCLIDPRCEGGRCAGTAIFLGEVDGRVYGENGSQTTVARELQFTAEVSTNCPDVEYLWVFGDGTTSRDQNPRHTYEKVGRFKPKLTVTCSQCPDRQSVDQLSVEVSTLDTALVAWIDEAPLLAALPAVRAAASPLLLAQLDSPFGCETTLGQWVVGIRAFIFTDADRLYANVFSLAGTPNRDPGPFVTPDVVRAGRDYRLFSRFRAIFDSDGGTIANVSYLEMETDVGPTPNPCPPVGGSVIESQPHPTFDDQRGVTTSGQSVYQLTQGRVGVAGQAADRTLNLCDAPPFGTCLQYPVGPTTPWIWGVIKFDETGLATIENQIFPTYTIYEEGLRREVIPQGDPNAFIDLDAASSELDPSSVQ